MELTLQDNDSLSSIYKENMDVINFTSELLNGNTLYMGVAILALWHFRKQDNKKMDEISVTLTTCVKDITNSVNKLNDTFSELGKETALHAKDLENGDKRFEKLEEDNRQIRQHLHEIKNSMVTKEDIQFYIKEIK